METGRNHKLAVELTYPLRIGLQQMNQLQQAALLVAVVGALPCARLERCGDEADLRENGKGGVLAQRS